MELCFRFCFLASPALCFPPLFQFRNTFFPDIKWIARRSSTFTIFRVLGALFTLLLPSLTRFFLDILVQAEGEKRKHGGKTDHRVDKVDEQTRRLRNTKRLEFYSGWSSLLFFIQRCVRCEKKQKIREIEEGMEVGRGTKIKVREHGRKNRRPCVRYMLSN